MNAGGRVSRRFVSVKGNQKSGSGIRYAADKLMMIVAAHVSL